MTNQNDDAPADGVVANGIEYAFTYHVGMRIQERIYERIWIVDVLENWIARRFEAAHNSMNYFGFIAGRNSLLMVCVSANWSAITTVCFNSAGTVRYHRKDYGYFDEVRGNAHS